MSNEKRITFKERNRIIFELVTEFQALHDKYTSSTRILTDEEWETYIHSMEDRLAEYKDTNLFDVAGDLWMCYLNDTEFVQKQLKKVIPNGDAK